MKPQQKRSIINIETIIIVAIAACVVFLNTFANNKFNDLQRVGNEAMFIMEDLEYSESDKFREEILKYRPDSCKMIEMYNSEFELLFSLQFNNAHSIHDDNMIAHPELINVLTSEQAGQTTIETDNYKEHIYFQWVTNDHDENRLVIVYSYLEEVQYIWIFQLVCYLILVLVFVLLIRLHLKEYQNAVNNYERVSKNFRDEVNRK